MSPSSLLRAALVLGAPLAFATAAPQAGAPDLRLGTAPFVGQTLTLQVTGAVPNSPIELYFSPEAASRTTPYGTLELKSAGMQLLADGVTCSMGTWSFSTDVPLQQALAETDAHFQALVDDPSAPAGRRFTNAVHARFLGPRVYARGGTGIDILSAVSEGIVARVDFAVTGVLFSPRHEWKPVFDATYSRGAIMSSESELLFFDPFFGGVLGRTSFASNCAGALLTDTARERIYVLEPEAGILPMARVHAIDFASGNEIGFLDLPNTAEPIWCADDTGTEAFVAEIDPGGRTAVRWIGLDPLADRGSSRVGTASSSSFVSYDGTSDVPLPMVHANGQLFVSTWGWQGMSALGSVSRCRTSPSGLWARVTDLGPSILRTLVAIPAADRLIGSEMRTDWGPWGWMCQMPLSVVGAPASLAWPPTGPEMYVHDIEADGTVAWILAESEWQHSDVLYRLDLDTMTWTVTPYFWFLGRNDVEVLRDAWNHEVWVSNETQLGSQRAGIRIVDELHGTSRHLVFDHFPGALHAVPLP